MATLNLFKYLKEKYDQRKAVNRLQAEYEAAIKRKTKKTRYAWGGFRDRNTGAIYSPPRTRFKGYMRENRRCTFNKNK